jgi:hypothetical protein
MATIQVLKLTPISAVIKVFGAAGSATIALATTLKLASETIGTPKVDINGIHASVLGNSTIVRNSETLWTLGTYPISWRFENWCDNQDDTSDIVVTLGTGGGTIVLELTKKDGYGDYQTTNALL